MVRTVRIVSMQVAGIRVQWFRFTMFRASLGFRGSACLGSLGCEGSRVANAAIGVPINACYG